MPLLVLSLISIVGLSVLLADVTTRAIASRPAAALQVSVTAAVATLAVISVHVIAPFAAHTSGELQWQGFVYDYILAMGHRLYGGPYPFFWSPPGIYPVSAFTPLLVPGAVLTAWCAFVGRRHNSTLASVLIAFGVLVMAGFVVALAYVGYETRNGIPV